MRIIVTSPSLDLANTDRDYAVRRLGFALGRFSDRVVQVTLTLGDRNAQRGGVDKFSRMVIRLRTGEPIIVTVAAATIREAVDLVAERAKRAVSRRIGRFRTIRAGAASHASQAQLTRAVGRRVGPHGGKNVSAFSDSAMRLQSNGRPN